MEVRITGETPIENLEISVRLQRCLFNIYPELKGRPSEQYYRPEKNLGLPPPKVKDFASLTEAQMLRYPNFGRKSYREWRDIVLLTQDPYDPAVEEEMAGRKAIKDLRYFLAAIAGGHRSLARDYEKISDLIAPLG
jgi:hypothetical protein